MVTPFAKARIDLTGQRFGRLVVLEQVAKKSAKHHSSRWKCRCDCGRDHSASGHHLRQGRTRSCGCLLREVAKNRHERGFQGVSGTYWSSLRVGAAARGLEFSVTPKDGWTLWLKQKGRCAVTGVELKLPAYARNCRDTQATASLDRIDNSKGYVVGNIQWVHKRVNLMKHTMTMDEFVDWCRKVVDHHWLTTICTTKGSYLTPS